MKIIILFPLSILLSLTSLAQQKERPLPPNINQPSINLFAPFVSGNGKALVYLSDYTDDGHHTMYFTHREGFEWEDGVEINSLVNRPTLNFRGGYALDYTGERLFITSRKTGLGGFDIWVSERNGNDWHAPKNLGSPVNSRENEGSPVLTPDGELMYFMRCEAMKNYGGASGCRIMVSRWRNNRWSEPRALPDNINTGNSQTPRILGDGETLIFSSDKFNGKGGLDLYMTEKAGDEWTNPVPLEFLNTEHDDAFISIPAKGRYAYVSRKGKRYFELTEQLIPESLRPGRVMRITGTVKTEGPAHLLVFNAEERNRLWNEKIENNGSFSLVLKEGNTYDFSVSADDPGYNYYSEILSLQEIGRLDRRNLEIELTPAQYGDTVSNHVWFQGPDIPEQFIFEMRRIADFIKNNPQRNVTLEIRQDEYREDSVAGPDLSGIRIDTLFTPPEDTIVANPLSFAQRKIVSTGDSIDFIIPDADTLRYSRDWFISDTTYHNDRTESQEKYVIGFLKSRGVDSTDYSIKRILTPASPPPTHEFGVDQGENEDETRVSERLVAIIRD